MTESEALRILIVDDEEIVHRTLGQHLRRLGHQVESVMDGESGLRALEEKELDLALVDIRMPGMDGLTLLSEVGRHHPETAVVLVTGHGSLETAIEALRLGAADYLTKPVKLLELEAVVEKAARIRRLRRLEREVEARTAELAQRNRELEQVNRRLREASLTDSLTGLRNRRYLSAFIHQDVSLVDREYHYLGSEGGERVPPPDQLFLMIDLDGLKAINDTYGHESGDQILVALGHLLAGVCRDSDTVIRWGGDEFLVVGRHADRAAAEALAERIRSTVEAASVELATREVVRLTCSIGFAFYPLFPSAPRALGWEQVLRLADQALLIAKRSGRNAWVGLLGRTASPDLLRRLKRDLRGLVAEGKMAICSSLPERDLVLGSLSVSPLCPGPGAV